MSPYSPIVTAELFIEAMGKEQQLLAKQRALAWRAAHRSTIDHSFITISGSSGIRRRVVVLTTTIASLEALPENVGYVAAQSFGVTVKEQMRMKPRG